MMLTLDWKEIALRLLLTVAAGVAIGFDRGERGHAAGIRTTTLVCLAASVAMIQANVLLPTAGKVADGFVNIDVMRLPLGILSGIGFIGGGAILRKDDRIAGVTTAATLWFVTVIGLCFGGGQLGLGLVGTGSALLVLTGLKWLDLVLRREHRAVLTVEADGETALSERLKPLFARSALRASYVGGNYDQADQSCELRYDVRWHDRAFVSEPTEFIRNVSSLTKVTRVSWEATSR